MEKQFTDSEIQKMVMVMDMHGYEQDGDGPSFVHVSGDCDSMDFRSWQAVLEFISRGFVAT